MSQYEEHQGNTKKLQGEVPAFKESKMIISSTPVYLFKRNENMHTMASIQMFIEAKQWK